MSAGRGLYTPEVLAAAMELTRYPMDDALPFKGSARSRSCGSTIDIAVSLASDGGIATVGIRPHACAVGQASAALFARGAVGLTADDLRAARAALGAWLAGNGLRPEWPGIELVEPARAYPARHGAILLAWDAAIEALK
ncbi:NifU-like protein involved in Fe-S cluster formation [Novosphingobium hassiacum]|uniref:NifU-like protein involved in Fe-S cluster formation n=1 Tax=Novosphingobium hassiacum TaxID=173676 RepID=A0A7W5ZZI2_9SPHN|nr:iron-sulfur cluster assembly scaffold protein [Novosphingobium hassiacum]MBB3861172.1 NifU-like protein involved in Fe-S cluster formation [Novosphingobium hassiacum]